MELNRKNLQKIFILIVCCILVYLGLQNMNVISAFLGKMLYVLLPFIVAGCCTFFLNVPVKAIEKHLFRPKDGKPVSTMKEKARRPLAIILSISIFIAVIGIFLTTIIPEIGKSIASVAEAVPGSIKNLQEWVNQICKENQQVNEFVSGLSIDWNVINNTLVNFLQNDAANFFSSIMGMLTSIVNITINIFLGIVLSIYVLMRKEKLSSDLKKVAYSFLPLKAADFIVDLGKITNQSFYNCITGQMTECVILGGLTALGMTIFNFPYAALIGVLIAIMSWIPMFGVGIGIAIGALLILIESQSIVEAFWFVVFMVCLQQIEGNFIYPRVVGSNIGLPPMFVISAIIIFSSLFGVIGLLVSVPVTSVLYTLMRRFVYIKIRERDIPKEKYAVVKADYTSDKKTIDEDKSKASKRSSIFSKKKK